MDNRVLVPKPKKYQDSVSVGHERRIDAAISEPEDLFLVDTAFEAFIDHINATVNSPETEGWDIEISLVMTRTTGEVMAANDN